MLRGNRAWINSDDGYDLISQEVPVTIENCWAVMSGYANGGSTRPGSGNGNGFKAGSSKTGIRHVLQNNVAWKNGAAGFYANHSSGGNTWLNNTAYMNSVQYNMLASPSGDTSMTIILYRRAGAQDAKQHRLPQQEHQHGGRRHAVQHLGPRDQPRRTTTSRARWTPAMPGRARQTAAFQT